MTQNEKITEESLYNSGFILLGFDLFLRTDGAKVKMGTSKTGKVFFQNNGRIVAYMHEIDKESHDNTTEKRNVQTADTTGR